MLIAPPGVITARQGEPTAMLGGAGEGVGPAPLRNRNTPAVTVASDVEALS